MKNLVLLALAAILVASAPAAAGSKTFQFEAHDDEGVYFTLEGQSAKNPTITVAPGDEVTVFLNNVGPAQPHNWEIVGQGAAKIACCLTAAQEGNVTFTAPTAGTYTYRCLPHESQGMKGTFTVASATTTDGDDPAPAGDSGTPSVGLLGVLAAAGAALVLVRRR